MEKTDTIKNSLDGENVYYKKQGDKIHTTKSISGGQNVYYKKYLRQAKFTL